MEIFNALSPYIYLEVVLGVFFLTWFLKKYVPLNLHPKWLTLIAGIVCSIADVIFREEFEFWILAISFLVSTGFYDYIAKPLKEKFLPKQ